MFLPTFQAIGYEYTVEMTYPLPEGMSASVLNAFSQVYIQSILSFIQLLQP